MTYSAHNICPMSQNKFKLDFEEGHEDLSQRTLAAEHYFALLLCLPPQAPQNICGLLKAKYNWRLMQSDLE